MPLLRTQGFGPALTITSKVKTQEIHLRAASEYHYLAAVNIEIVRCVRLASDRSLSVPPIPLSSLATVLNTFGFTAGF